ncbi:hypothetical protein ACT7DH_10485 [Bacillus pacificus]
MKFVTCENEGVFDSKRMYSAEQAFKKNVAGMWGTRSLETGKLIYSFCSMGEIEKHNCHPYWEIAYYNDEGNVVRSYQKGEYADIRKRGLAVVPAVL